MLGLIVGVDSERLVVVEVLRLLYTNVNPG
jgi:hypothetical protein